MTGRTTGQGDWAVGACVPRRLANRLGDRMGPRNAPESRSAGSGSFLRRSQTLLFHFFQSKLVSKHTTMEC